MTQAIYQVRGIYPSGRIVSHFVGADNARIARDSVLNADGRILRIISINLADV